MKRDEASNNWSQNGNESQDSSLNLEHGVRENRATINRRPLLKRLGVVGTLGAGTLTSAVSADSGSPLQVGASATYNIRRVRERPTGERNIIEYSLYNEIVGQEGDRLLIDVERRRQSDTETGRYSVPIHALQPMIPGSSRRTFDLSKGDVTLQGTARDGWFDKTAVVIEENGFGRYELTIDLQARSGGTADRSSRAFWLVPTFISPADGAQPVQSGDDSTSERSTLHQNDGQKTEDATSQQTDSYYAYSKLITKDNQLADLTVWTSKLTGVGNTFDFEFDNAHASITTTTPAGAWSLDRKSTSESVLSNKVRVTGESHFRGAFPYSCGGISLPVQQWKGHSYHAHDITQSGHTTYLRGKIETDYCSSGRDWLDWNENVFYDESVTYGDSTQQQATWYIV